MDYDDNDAVSAVERLRAAGQRRTDLYAQALAAHLECKAATLELVVAGLKVSEAATLSGFTRQAIYGWIRESQDMGESA